MFTTTQLEDHWQRAKTEDQIALKPSLDRISDAELLTELESFVVNDLRKQIEWSDSRVTLHHYQTSLGPEVDILLEDAAGQRVGMERQRTLQHPGEDVPLRDGEPSLPSALERGIEMLDLDSSLFMQHGRVLHGSNWPSNLEGNPCGLVSGASRILMVRQAISHPRTRAEVTLPPTR